MSRSVPRSAQCRSSRTSSSAPRAGDPAERAVDGIEQALARAGGILGARTQGRVGIGLAQRLRVGLERRQRFLPAAPEQDERAAGLQLLGELPREPRLADPRLAGDHDHPPGPVHLDVRPRGAQPVELAGAPHEGEVRLAREDRGCRDGRAIAADRVEQRAGLARRGDGEGAAQALGETLARGQRGGAVAGGGEALDQPAVGLLGQRVERHLLARQANRFGGGRRRREQFERPGEPVRVGLARLVGPVVLEAVEDRRRAGVERRGGVVARERGVERPRVDPEPVVEDDRLAGGDHVGGGRPERPAQLGQRGPQARAGRLVEHVGPEARGDLRAAVRARVERQVGEHATGAARGGGLDVRTLEPQPAGESQLQHG